MKKGFISRFFDRWIAKIFSILAAVLLSLFYQISNLEERYFSIPLQINTNRDFSISGNFPLSVRVNLKGSEEMIYSILDDNISAVADFTAFDSEGSFKVPVNVQLNTAAGSLNETMEVNVEPSEITIFQEKTVTKSLEITPSLSNFPPNGYELVQYFISPSFATVQGPESQLSETYSVKTEEIDLSGRYDDFTVSSRLIPPGENVSFPGGNTVEIRGVVDEAIIIQNLSNLEIVAIDLNQDYIINQNLPDMSITIQGSQLTLEQLRPGDLHFYLDCSKIIVPGTYTLPIRIDMPEGIAVLKYEPREIPVSFSYRGTEP